MSSTKELREKLRDELYCPASLSVRQRREAADALDAAEARIAKLEAALSCALKIWVKIEPPDSRAVSNEFVACAAVQAGLADLSQAEDVIRAALEDKSHD